MKEGSSHQTSPPVWLVSSYMVTPTDVTWSPHTLNLEYKDIYRRRGVDVWKFCIVAESLDLESNSLLLKSSRVLSKLTLKAISLPVEMGSMLHLESCELYMRKFIKHTLQRACRKRYSVLF